MRAAPLVRGGLPARLASLVFGLFLVALAIVYVLRSGLGLPPWDVLHQGIARHSPLSFGQANIAVAIPVLFAGWALGARPGLGTAANATLVGVFIDVLTSVDAVPETLDDHLLGRITLLVLGIGLFGAGSAFYIGAALGAGPRDSLMLVLATRARVRVGLSRAVVELSALASGASLGGTVGLGTLAFALSIGPAVELWFWILARTPLARRGVVDSPRRE